MTFEEFQQVDLRVARVTVAERVVGSDKLVRLEVNLGEELGGESSSKRQIVAGIGKTYDPDKLIGREIIVVVNLDPRKLMGLESNGMLLAASDENGEPVLLGLDKEVPPGSRIT